MLTFEELLRLSNDARTRIREITADEARDRVAAGAFLIDVREEKEFRAGNIPGAILISRDALESRIAEVVPDKSTAIVVYCTIGHRSALAADTLQQLGYQDVSSIEGGLKAYLASSKERKIA